MRSRVDPGPPTPQASVVVAHAARPARWLDYIELAKPRMNFLVIVTTVIGYWMAASQPLHLGHLLQTLLATAMLAASASVLNQYAERAHDAKMDRTAGRPLPAGRVLPAEALAIGSTLAVAGFAWLLAATNALAALLGLFTLASYILIYTPLKRVTSLCTVVGALPGAIPPVIGWAAAAGRITPEAVALFGILFLWQMPHFLAIGILWREDYAKAGFVMLPVVDRSLGLVGRQIVLYSLWLVPASLAPAAMGMVHGLYVGGALLLGIGLAACAVACARNRRRADARRLFIASILYLPLLLGLLVIDKVRL
jgi:protoheme IX farnesyltransferase